jgi:Flp pilus assembly protein TadG
MADRARGTFEVRMTPKADDQAASAGLARMLLDKTFHGDLDGTSKGQMLGAMTQVEGSAGYVAIERVEGTLAGRRGTFMLQHSGSMTRGQPNLTVTVVPDSGTGQLASLSGTMTIIIEGAKHLYEFQYRLES